MNIIGEDKEAYFVKCRFEHNHLLEGLDKRWNKRTRSWRVYKSRLNIALLVDLGLLPKDQLSSPPMVPAPLDLIFHTEPRLYQEGAVRFLLSLPYGALIAPMGSGKTKIMIDVINNLIGIRDIKALIIGLVSIKKNWEDEIKMHAPETLPFCRIEGIESLSSSKKLNKELQKYVDDRTLVVIDEAHTIKNPNAKRTKNAYKIAKPARRRYVMTGTPVLNGKEDLFSIYGFLNPDIIGISTFIGFKNRYCIRGGFENRQIVGYKNEDELMENISKYTFFISKKDAMPHLPPQTDVKRECKMTPKQRELINVVLNDGELNPLTKLLRILQISGGYDPVSRETFTAPKIKLLDEIVETGETLVIYANFISEIRTISERYNAPFIDGGISPKDRHEIVQDFQNGAFPVIVAHPAVGSTGINLHCASTMVFYSYSHNLGHYQQAKGRIARMQQINPMVYYHLITKGTLDARVLWCLQHKKSILKNVEEILSQLD